MAGALPVLYSFRRCPYAMRARLALAVSGQACELREVALKAKPAELLAASPAATVPVLVLPQGQVIAQSLAIMHWALARHDPCSWLASDPGQAARAQTLIDACDQHFKHHLDRYKYPGRHVDGGDAALHRNAGALWLAELDAQLSPQGWLGGPAAALPDMAIAPFVRQFAQTDAAWFAVQPWPRLRTWLAAIVAGPLFEQVMRKYPNWQSGHAGAQFPTFPSEPPDADAP